MHEYDAALKTLLCKSRLALLAVTGMTIDRWHNVELQEIRNRRADLLGESGDGRLIHFELQSTNDSLMGLRMMEYCAAIYRQFERVPEQVVLYVGDAPLRMSGKLAGPHFRFDCRIVDIRELDGEGLLESEQLEDNVIAILAGLTDRIAAVKRILSRIAAADPAERPEALAGFLILAGLRRLGEAVEKEAHRMPLLDDIMDHPVLGREYKRGLEKGLEKGLQRGRRDGELALLLRLIEKRFGAVQATLRERIEKMSDAEIEAAGLRVLDARSPEDLLA